jgi:hypothetical protein
MTGPEMATAAAVFLAGGMVESTRGSGLLAAVAVAPTLK